MKAVSSQQSVPPQHEVCEMTKNTTTSISSVSAASSFISSSSSSLHLLKTPTTSSKPPEPQSALTSPVRWTRKYDVCVCHSSVDSDIEKAAHLVSFLEASPNSLRCFLWQRDASPGGAIPSELCQAVQNSHFRVLLITPDFLQDGWCRYMIHQALAERPMSHQMIPLVQNLSHTQYPMELKFFHYIDLNKNPEAYTLVGKTVLNYLENIAKNEKTLDCNIDSSSNRFSEADSSQENKQKLTCDPSGTSVSLGMIETTNEGLTDVCWDQHEQ
ncbi:toll/interleukin-1 receptor domain-containing adapter protein isoform X2 [Myripristis murdjan]|uniref:TIR domain containing adaptor protein n=2 Tax=Myripristis murdjan TaxID=586833 RepID=A0A667X9E2_9TELE|nr:toll/interleukin-1 receptor domain-containing adapter protein isoform X2 [Myripristis murdjan]